MFPNIYILAIKWYLRSNKDLPFGKLIHRIANKGVVSKQELRHFEKLALRKASYQEHLRYFNKCLELDLIPDFIPITYRKNGKTR